MERMIVMDKEEVRIEYKSKILNRQCFEDLRDVFVVQIDEPVPSEAETTCVAVFSNSYWVVPALSSGTAEFFNRLTEIMSDRSHPIKRCDMASIPWSWRRKLAGFLPLFPDPELGSHPLASMPRMENAQTITAGEFESSMR